MTFFPSLPDDAHVAHVFARYPHIYKLYSMASRGIMRGPSPLSYQQRETLGAFVSALNGCDFCYGAHSRTAQLFGLEEGLLEALVENIDTAAVPADEKPLFNYAKKLTQTPAYMVQADADAVYAAGWDEDALHSVIAVVCTFSFMNRFAPGMGVDTKALDFDHLGKERQVTEWEAMVPVEASKVAATNQEAFDKSLPDWGAVWGIDVSE